MEILVLNAEEVRRSLPMKTAIEGMKSAFAQLSAKEATVPLRNRIDIDEYQGLALFMPAMMHKSQDMAIKIITIYPGNVNFGLKTAHAIVIVLDPKTGRTVAILEGGSLTAIRTGAASGAATDLLARSDSRRVALFGSGVQARTQLEAVCTVRNIEEVWLYSIDRPGAEKFIAEMAGKTPIPNRIHLAKDSHEAVAHADIICTATTSATPVFDGHDLRQGMHINAIGSYKPNLREVDAETLKRSYIVVDTIEGAPEETGDLFIPLHDGEIGKECINVELGEIVLGNKPGRTSDDQITYFKSTGIAVQDVVAANLAMANAREMGLGQIIDL